MIKKHYGAFNKCGSLTQRLTAQSQLGRRGKNGPLGLQINSIFKEAHRYIAGYIGYSLVISGSFQLIRTTQRSQWCCHPRQCEHRPWPADFKTCARSVKRYIDNLIWNLNLWWLFYDHQAKAHNGPFMVSSKWPRNNQWTYSSLTMHTLYSILW